METATAATRNQPSEIVVDNYDVNAMSTVDTNPLEVRWAFNPVQRDKVLDARVCGVAHVPFARFFPVRSFQSPRERHSIDWTQPKEETAIIPAAEAQREIEQSLSGTSAQVKTDWGCRFGFLGVRDIARMEVLTQTIVPTLDTIREICRDHDLNCPISDVCEGSDGLSGSRDTCITCWNRWVNSDACDRYCEIVAQTGLQITERDTATGETKNRLVRPTAEEMKTGLEMVRECFRVGIASLQTQWRTIDAEIDKNERKGLTPFEDMYRQDLHENKPQDRQIAMVEKFARASTAGNQGNGDLIAQLAQSTIQTQQMMAMILQNQQQNAAPQVSNTDDDAAKALFVAKMAEAKQKKNQGEN